MSVWLLISFGMFVLAGGCAGLMLGLGGIGMLAAVTAAAMVVGGVFAGVPWLDHLLLLTLALAAEQTGIFSAFLFRANLIRPS
jgi:hypothetical protein